MAADPDPRASSLSAFETTEVELFDVDAIPFTTRNARSVGEMLSDIDHQARQLLWDVDGDAAAGLVRGWPALVAAAAEFWGALPLRTGAETLDRPMDRLTAYAATMKASLTTGWPGPGEPDPRIAHFAETLHGAAALVRHYGTEIPIHITAVRHDLEAARTRTMHGLYVTAHAIHVALHAHGRDQYRQARDTGRRIKLSTAQSPYAVAPTARWIARFATTERTAEDYLTGHFFTAITGEARQPLTDQNRIPRALACWEIQAHRTLTTSPSAANNVLIARTQALIGGVGIVLLHANTHRHRDGAHRATPYVPDRVVTALEAVSSAWSNLATRWDDLRAPTERHDPQLLRAAAEVRAAYRELTHDLATMARPEVIAARQGLDRALSATLRAIETGPEIAEALADKASSPGLVGPARALSLRAHNDIEARVAKPHPAGDIVWVSPADIHARRLVPLPPPVAQTLQIASSTTTSATLAAAAAAALGDYQGPVKRPTTSAQLLASSHEGLNAKNRAPTSWDGRDRWSPSTSPR